MPIESSVDEFARWSLSQLLAEVPIIFFYFVSGRDPFLRWFEGVRTEMAWRSGVEEPLACQRLFFLLRPVTNFSVSYASQEV